MSAVNNEESTHSLIAFILDPYDAANLANVMVLV